VSSALPARLTVSRAIRVDGRDRPTGGFCDANLITLDRDGRAYYQKDAAGIIQPNVVRAFPGRRVCADPLVGGSE
jgi:hypothetical protein